MNRLVTLCWLIGLGTANAQLTAPGLEGAKAVGWIAAGFTQTLSPRWSTTLYAGTSRQSSLASYAFWQKQAISVVNQEWAYQYTPHWQLVVAASIRFQDLYEESPPYEPRDPAIRDELRAYARLFFRHTQGKKLSWAHSFRPEYRLFLTPDWKTFPSPFQIRLRWKSQLGYPVNAANTVQFIAANEVLTTVDRVRNSSSQALGWGPYKFSEDRLSMFIRRILKKPALTIDTGLMHQFWWDATTQRLRYTTYLSVDFLLRNPFKRGEN